MTEVWVALAQWELSILALVHLSTDVLFFSCVTLASHFTFYNLFSYL